MYVHECIILLACALIMKEFGAYYKILFFNSSILKSKLSSICLINFTKIKINLQDLYLCLSLICAVVLCCVVLCCVVLCCVVLCCVV